MKRLALGYFLSLSAAFGQLVTLAGNTRPEATVQNDRGAVADSFPLHHMLLQLRRSPEKEVALEAYIDQLHDTQAGSFHQWLTPEQFGAQYGVAQNDVARVTAWLEGNGFTVHGAPLSGMVIDFSGTAGQVRHALHTEIHKLSVGGVSHFANMSDPQIPAGLADVVSGVVSLHNFHPKPQMVRKRPQYTYTTPIGTFHALVPGDLQTIYNIKPLLAAGYSGKGQSIMVVEDTYLYSANDFDVFRKTFGLTKAYPHGGLSQISPQGAISCANPGFQGSPSDPGYGDDGEAAIDVEWATSAAPDAKIILAACEDTETTFGGLIALQNTLNGPWDKLPSVVSISYGESESYNGAAANRAFKEAYQQAVAEGVSIFVSAGDEDAAESDFGSPAQSGITVSGWASTPYNVAVGGLDFGYTANGIDPGEFWNAKNSSTYSSAKRYIQEIPWNASCASSLITAFLAGPGVSPLDFCNSADVAGNGGIYNFYLNAAGGSGGPSGCAYGSSSVSEPGAVSGTCRGYAKPSWQRDVYGNPRDEVRDIPDVALFASNGIWDAYYVVCWSNPDTNPIVGGGYSCTGAPSMWAGFGGTSVSSPIMAAIQALVNQKTESRWGNPNTVYYSLAKHEFGHDGRGAKACNSTTVGDGSSCVFYDVTEGDNSSVCTAGTNGVLINCYAPDGDAYGILSTSNRKDKPAYETNTGWDFTSGIGSVNAWNLVMNWPECKSGR
jgi:subtilase family serine protease